MGDVFATQSDKRCGGCKQVLPRSAFHSNVRRGDRLAYYCRTCANVRQEESRRRRGIAPKRRSEMTVPVGQKWCPDCDAVKPLEDPAQFWN